MYLDYSKLRSSANFRVVTPAKAFHSVTIGLCQSYDFCIYEKVNLIKRTSKRDCSTAYGNSTFFIPARKTGVVFLSFYLSHTFNYPYGKERMQMNDWQGFLTWLSLFGHAVSPWEGSPKQLLLTLCFELLRLVAKICVMSRMSLFRHVLATSDIFCLSMNIWHHLPNCIGPVTILLSILTHEIMRYCQLC